MAQDRQVEIMRVDALTTCVRLAGSWRIQDGLPSAAELERRVDQATCTQRIRFDTAQLAGWDSSLLTFIVGLTEGCRGRGASVDTSGLPEGVRQLLALATAVPDARPDPKRKVDRMVRVGLRAEQGLRSVVSAVSFVGQATLALGTLLRGRARHRRSDLYHEIQAAGAEALPIVTLISLMVGMILGFVGGVTLRDFGATILIANLVAVAVVRELAAMMTAIIVAGRTGSAYAAELSAMQVSEELDALVTMGIPPMQFIVVSRLVALSLMLPLLCVYADFVGLVGGGFVAVEVLGLTSAQYTEQIRHSITMTTFWIGIAKSVVFGVLIAISGCWSGLEAGRSAADVGGAATRAVVRSIVWVIVADGFFAVVLYALGL